MSQHPWGRFQCTQNDNHSRYRHFRIGLFSRVFSFLHFCWHFLLIENRKSHPLHKIMASCIVHLFQEERKGTLQVSICHLGISWEECALKLFLFSYDALVLRSCKHEGGLASSCSPEIKQHWVFEDFNIARSSQVYLIPCICDTL